MAEQRYWFNTRTGQVETDDAKAPSRDLLGPYATADEAREALHTARARTQAWDEEERRWNEGDESR